MGEFPRRALGTVVLIAVLVAMLAMPAVGSTNWRTHASVTSRAGTHSYTEVLAGADFRGADAVRLRFRSPDGTARSVDVWYYAECADGRSKEISPETPRRITTKADGAWTTVTIFKTGSKAGSCWVEGGGWYPRSTRQLDFRLQSSTP